MQVSEIAAREWAKETHVPDFRAEELFDPKTNLDAGAWYLHRALQRWQREQDPLPFALAEYNAGASRAQRWAGGNNAVLSSDTFRENIDFPGTRKYVDSVVQRYEFYKAAWANVSALGAVLICCARHPLPRQTHNPSALSNFEAGAGAHDARTESQTALEFSNVSEIPALAASGSPEVPSPTRGGFMASWGSISEATGYRLDVSTNGSFSSYVNGYHSLDVGNATRRVVTGLDRGTTYYYRVRAYDATGTGAYSHVMTATTMVSAGLIVNASFDSSITNNPNAEAIQAMINRAISICESLFSDPITVSILFRYSTTTPDGTHLPSGIISRSDWVYYVIPWSTYINALRADAKTSNDISLRASLPGALFPTLFRRARAGEQWGWTRHRRCLQTAPSATAGRSMESLRFIPRRRFSSLARPASATTTRSVRLSTKLTKSSVLDRT